MNSDWQWGPAWNALRQDVNMLAWLFEEERVIQRLYIESFMWALTGKRFAVDEFARQVGVSSSAQSPADDPERSAAGALDTGSQGQG